MKIILTRSGSEILVDDEDFDALSGNIWRVSDKGYAIRTAQREDGRRFLVMMHRHLLGLSFGDGKFVDHANGNRLDNRKGNLRLCNRSQNNWNSKRRDDNKSGFKGVHFCARNGKWASKIKRNGKTKHLGYFDNPHDAHAAYCDAASRIYGDFANFGDIDSIRAIAKKEGT